MGLLLGIGEANWGTSGEEHTKETVNPLRDHHQNPPPLDSIAAVDMARHYVLAEHVAQKKERLRNSAAEIAAQPEN